MFLTLFVIAHIAACLGYAAFAGLLALRSARSWLSSALILAAASTAIWAALVVLAQWSLVPEWIASIAAPLRDGAWYAVVLAVLYLTGYDHTLWRRLVVATAFITALYAVLVATDLSLGTLAGVRLDSRAAGIGMVIIGFVLVENMLRNVSKDQFWAVKFFAFGLLGILIFQFLARLPEFLIGTPPDDVVAALPLIFLLVLPLFVVTAVRSPTLNLRVHSSRKVVFHTAALVVVGVLLQGTALAAYYVRTNGGDAATVLSIVLGFSCAIAIAVAAASTALRSRLRIFINENFFSYKYDYRLEWTKFIRALSAMDAEEIPLRVLRTLAEILDSPGGALWVLRDRSHQFMPVANWSFHTELAPLTPDDPGLAAFDDENCAFVELLSPQGGEASALWHERFPAAWLLVPLRYRTVLVGVALINKPRAERDLDWEDHNLIGLVSLQLAAYLVQEETAQALADTRQLTEFTKRFAFILHDTKKTIGKRSLLVRNAEQFGHQEEFRKDMIVTLRHSVEKLQELLSQLKGDRPATRDKAVVRQSVDIAPLASAVVQEKRKLGLNIVMNEVSSPAFVEIADQKAFVAVLDHVITNAVEANPKEAPVKVRVGAMGSFVRVAVEDTGPGMTPRFIAEELFRPLRTTKRKGFGIGAYQAREMMRDLGGDIEVRSKLGEGTTMTLLLPSMIMQKEVARA